MRAADVTLEDEIAFVRDYLAGNACAWANDFELKRTLSPMHLSSPSRRFFCNRLLKTRFDMASHRDATEARFG